MLMRHKKIFVTGMAGIVFLICAVVYLFFRMSRPLADDHWKDYMSRETYQAYRLQKEHLALENERLSRQLQSLQRMIERKEIVLEKVKKENVQLRDKIQLMDEIAQLQDSIAELKHKNSQLVEKEAQVQKGREEDRVMSWNSLEEARAALTKERLRIQSVKERIEILTSQEKDEKVAVQQELDKIQSHMGNKGYLVREGTSLLGDDAGKTLSPDVRKDE